MGVVLTLSGAFLPLVTPRFGPWMRGELWAPARPGWTRINVPFNNWNISNQGATEGMNNLFDLIIQWAQYGPVDVLGHSMGAQIVFKLLRERSADLIAAGVDPANIRFIVTGCPEAKFNGACVRFPSTYTAVYPGTNPNNVGDGPFQGSGTAGGYGVGYGLPVGTIPWTVIVISRQYDGWADCNNTSTAAADENAQIGRDLPIHGDYGDVGLADSDIVTYVDPTQPTVSYKIKPTYPTAKLGKMKWLRFWAKSEDKKTRATIESAYSRPVAVPTPNYLVL